jgi:hypothetical protein
VDRQNGPPALPDLITSKVETITEGLNGDHNDTL